MVLYKITYRDKHREMKEYNRLDSIIRGMEAKHTIHEEKEDEKEKRIAYRGRE